MKRKKVTMKDIADRLSISNVTVSKALNDKEGVGDELREQIKEIANEIGYKYSNKSSQQLIDKSCKIGVIVADRFVNKTKAFYLEMYHNLTEVLSEYDYFSMLEIIKKDDELDCITPSIIQNNNFDGIIILGQMKEKYVNYIIGLGLPIVCLDFYVKNSKVPCVISDNFYGSYMLTNHLFENGHREIGFVGSINSTNSIQDRYLGYYKCLLENGLSLNSDYIIPDRNADGDKIEFILPEKLPTAFVCNCDQTAYNFIEHLNSLGINVPNDISIVGFDNYIYATLCKPQLTTVVVNMKKMVTASVFALINIINNKNNPSNRILISDKLLIRDSVKKI